MAVLSAGPADSVLTKASTPEPSDCAGVISRPSASSMDRPVTDCKSLMAARTPPLTSRIGASAVEGAVPPAMKRYSPSTTSKSTARVLAPPTSTAKRDSPSIKRAPLSRGGVKCSGWSIRSIVEALVQPAPKKVRMEWKRSMNAVKAAAYTPANKTPRVTARNTAPMPAPSSTIPALRGAPSALSLAEKWK